MPTTLLGRIGESSRTSGSAQRWPVKRSAPNGCPSTSATVTAPSPAPDSPSTAPNDIPPACTKRAIRTARIYPAPGDGPGRVAPGLRSEATREGVTSGATGPRERSERQPQGPGRAAPGLRSEATREGVTPGATGPREGSGRQDQGQAGAGPRFRPSPTAGPAPPPPS